MIIEEHQPARNREEAKEPVRVTDRRRINLDRETAEQAGTEVPSLKPTYVEELEARTKAAEKQVQEVQIRFDQLRQQLQKETDETRQRLNRAADERAAQDKARLITSLLPVMDDLTRAIESAETSDASIGALLKGLHGIAASFQNALAAAGVEPLETVGEDFNPELHEAVDTAEAETNMDGKVISEYSKGFKIGERLLRPARVKVGQSKPDAKNAME